MDKGTIDKVKPFLRWAGGKNWLKNEIEKFLPKSFGHYYEPFLGGGSIFFHLSNLNKIESATLSDTNENLINAYRVIQNKSDSLVKDLKNHINNEKYYYTERSKVYHDSVKRASWFIYLNRTSFNGIYRENLNGDYNVPYGHKSYSELFNYDNIFEVSKTLKNSILLSDDFEIVVKNAIKNDLIFFDPPYTVAHANNGFVKYNQKIFSWDDQIRLSKLIKRLDKKGVYFILTNAFHNSVLQLYNGVGEHHRLKRFSVVGGKGAKRDKYSEILITNIR